MPAAIKALTVEAGATWSLSFQYKVGGSPVDITGAHVVLEVRTNNKVATDPADWTASSDVQDTIPAEITVDGPAGTMTLLVPPARTLTLPSKNWSTAYQDGAGPQGDPKLHYTLKVIFAGGAPEKFLLTGPLTVLPA
jgi:hypothetical protein